MDEKIRLNITDEQGVLYGTVELTKEEIRVARTSPVGALAIVESISAEVGV